MTKLQDLLTEIQRTLQENNQNLTNEDPRLRDLSRRCENIHQLLNSIDNSLDNFKRLVGGIEIAPEEIQRSLQELNLNELTGDNLRTKLEEILKLAEENNTELVNAIKDAETELETILTNIKNQQTIIVNLQARNTELEGKIRSNENQTQQLQLKAGLIGASISAGLAGLLVILAKYLPKFRRNNE